MTSSRRSVLLPVIVTAAIGLSACGSDTDSAADDVAAPTSEVPEDTPEVTAVEDDEDHDDEDHDDDDHDDEDHDDEDHDDEDHADEDHDDEDHDDEDHDDEDHADEDHDDEDHDDEDHDDEDHDDEDHDDEDHDDDDHDDEDHDDEDHDDEDHDDEDHDDEDHDDEDHDDEDHDHGGLGAHEHGAAELSVAWIGADVAIDLISPTYNVFGFEYEPTSDEDLAVEADRTEALTAVGLIVVNDEAACTLTEPAETEVEREGSHSEITVSWLFSCDEPDAITQVDVSGLFAEFPNFEDVDAQWISETDQSSAELSPTSTTFTMSR